MSRLVLIVALLIPTLAAAQTAPDPSTQALGQMVLEAAQREANLRAQLIVAQARVAALETKIAAPTPASEAPK